VARNDDMLSPMRYGLLSLPGLIIDGKVISGGRVPSGAEMMAWLIQDTGAPSRTESSHADAL
jgi:hypothetical protein